MNRPMRLEIGTGGEPDVMIQHFKGFIGHLLEIL